MAIDDNTIYGLYGSQIKELPGKIDAVKGQAKVLTTNDYDYPTDDPRGWRVRDLSDGTYIFPAGSRLYYYNSNYFITLQGNTLGIIGNDTALLFYVANPGVGETALRLIKDATSYSNVNNAGVLTQKNIVDDLTSTLASVPLSANQGKVLKDLVDSLAIRGTGAPTTATVGQVGTLYEDTTNGDLYICTDATSPYVWEEVGGGSGGGITELTSADYDYDPQGSGTNTAVAAWRLPTGIYSYDGAIVYPDIGGIVSTRGLLVIDNEAGSVNTSIFSFDTGGNARAIATNTSTGASVRNAMMLDTTFVKQATGTSTADVMSQNAVTSMVFADPADKIRVKIGASSVSSANNTIAIGADSRAGALSCIAIGGQASARNNYAAVAIGANSSATGQGSVALGRYSSASQTGEMNIGSTQTTYGYNSSNYRLLTGLYDPQSAHDAATKGYVDTAVDAKQDELTAGTGITIEEESGALVISATGGGGADVFTTNEWDALWA